jgi:hypothetical protein
MRRAVIWLKNSFGDMSMDYLTVKEAGEKWGVTSRMAALYCADDRIGGAVKKGNLWLIPKDAPNPADGRRKKLSNHNGFYLRIMRREHGGE